MKNKKFVISIFILIFFSKELIAQDKNEINWQFGLNLVPLVDQLLPKSSNYKNLATSSNLFIVKRINNSKNNALRFSGNFWYNRNNYDQDRYFQFPYQLNIGLLAGYEKRQEFSKNVSGMIGFQVNPNFAVNPKDNDAIILFGGVEKEINYKNASRFLIESSGLAGLEYKFNNLISVSFESHLIYNYSKEKPDYVKIVSLHMGEVIYEQVRQSSDDIITYNNLKLKPIYYFNLNFTL